MGPEKIKLVNMAITALRESVKCGWRTIGNVSRTELADAIIELLAENNCLELAQPKWISVEERLPERDDASAGELVLCICADGDGKSCAKEIHAWHYSVVRRMAQCFTHWMPLPEPPKEEA